MFGLGLQGLLLAFGSVSEVMHGEDLIPPLLTRDNVV